MLYSLPDVGMDAIPLSHFPTRQQAFIFRAFEYIPIEKIAKILRTDGERRQTTTTSQRVRWRRK